jgi:hypothetical protein
MIQLKDDNVVAILVGLAEAAASPLDAELVGAGPIEDFLSEHGRWLASPDGSTSLKALAEFSRTSSSFRHALGGVWYEDHELPSEVRERLHGLPPPLGSS